MTRTPSVSLSFKSDSVSDKIIFANNVAAQLAANTVKFPTPDVTVAILNSKIAALATAAQLAESGDHQKIAARNAAEKTLDIVLETEAHYVDRIALGDIPSILLSGFRNTTAQTAAVAVPPAVTGIKVIASQQPGIAHVECDVTPTAKYFMYFVSTSPNAVVITNGQYSVLNNVNVISILNETHRKVDFNNLPSGQNLYLTIIAFNSTGAGAANAPIVFKTL